MRERAPEPQQRPAGPAQPATQRPRPGAAPGRKTKTSLNLPELLAERLRAWRDDTGRSHGDAIVSALIEHLDNLRQWAADDAERIELGLAPVTAPIAGDSVLITFWASPAAIARLDAAATSLAMTRSALITGLLDLFLPPLRAR